MSLLEVDNLTVNAIFATGECASIISRISFNVEKGEKIAIVGESGIGKTMIANAILGILPRNCTATGRICFNSINLLLLNEKDKRRTIRGNIAYIPQSAEEYLNPAIKVKDLLDERAAIVNIEKARRRNYIAGLLDSLGFIDIDSVLNSYPFQLSGGMAERIAIAIALMGSPTLIIADEPTKGIGEDNIALLKELLLKMNDTSLLMITHDMSTISICNRVLKLGKDLIKEVPYAP